MNRRLSKSARGERYALVLAAGKGKRFKSEKAKVLHALCGKPLIAHLLDRLKSLAVTRTFVVIGHQGEAVREALHEYQVEFIIQAEQLGTGHAALAAAPYLEDCSGNLLVLYADGPLITESTLRRLFETQEAGGADEVVLTCNVSAPTGYGRIIRDSEGRVADIIEEKDLTAQQKAIQEINPGYYCFHIPALLGALPQISRDNAQKEYYLTDLPRILRQEGKRVVSVSPDSTEETRGINDRFQLSQVEEDLRFRIARKWMLNGVTILNPATVSIDETVEIGRDTVIYPGVLLEGRCRIGSDCTIHGYSYLKNAELEDGVIVDHCSVIRDSRVKANSTVGPFAHLRQGTLVGPGSRIGNFVEVKQSTVGEGSKAAHLTYLGDASIGRGVNIGAGTITCNYDGTRKNKTIIEDGVFVGSDCQLIAPVTVGRGAYVAAGSTITQDVPAGALAIARGKQVNKKDWVGKKKERLKPGQ